MEQSFESLLQQKIEELSQNQKKVHSEFSFKSQENQDFFYKKIDIQYFASAEDEGRTEKPSEHKLRKAKEEGRVPKSQEIGGALVLLLPVACILILAPWIFKNCVEIIQFYISRSCSMEITEPAVYITFYYYFGKILLPIFGVSILAAICGNIIQTRGFMFTPKAISPKFNKLIPKFGEYFKRTLFSFEGCFNVIKSIVKVVIIFVVAFSLIKNNINQLLTLLETNLWMGIVFIAKLTGKLLIISACVFLAISIPDYLVQRHQFMESMKMTKQEVKEEYKEMEGDPEVKGRLKQMQQQLLSSDVRRAVAESDVVITNPTHFAVALKYDQAKTDSPMVNAKGEDQIAQTIKQIARDNNIPIVENRPVARELYTNLKVGDIIPQIYFNVIATIYSQLDKFKNK